MNQLPNDSGKSARPWHVYDIVSLINIQTLSYQADSGIAAYWVSGSCTDQPNDRILKWSIAGQLSTFLQPSGRANGLYFDHQGNLIACADEKNELYRKMVTRVTTELEKPNGIIGTPDGKTLYIADIDAGKTYAYDIQPDGLLTNKRLFCTPGSDGMTLDNEGNVYLTGNGVMVFNQAGQQIEHIDIPEGWTANVTFGGKDHHLLFITASKSVYGLKMRVSGVRQPRAAG